MIKIIQGGAIAFTVRLKNSQTNDPFDLTSCTALTTCFQNASGPELSLSLSGGIVIASALLGKITISLTAAQAAALALVDSGILELSIRLGTADPFKLQIPNAYSVLESVC